MTRQQFFNSLRYLHLKPVVADGRIDFGNGGSTLRKALDEMPELETEMILREATRNKDLYYRIKECASNRWADGYSDSLYDTVMCNLSHVQENKEYSDKPDEKQATFLRRMGIPEADIMNKEKCPSVWVKMKPKTDWNTELAKYR